LRPEGKLQLGYFPLPNVEASNIGKMLAFPEDKPITALDPCAATGKALLDITQASTLCTRYAVEIDARRARECASNGITTLHSDFADVDGSGTMSMVYCMYRYLVSVGKRLAKKETVSYMNSTPVLDLIRKVRTGHRPESEITRVLRTFSATYTKSFLLGFATAIFKRFDANRTDLEATASSQAAGLILRDAAALEN
jgi:hypothetical protein